MKVSVADVNQCCQARRDVVPINRLPIGLYVGRVIPVLLNDSQREFNPSDKTFLFESNSINLSRRLLPGSPISRENTFVQIPSPHFRAYMSAVSGSWSAYVIALTMSSPSKVSRVWRWRSCGCFRSPNHIGKLRHTTEYCEETTACLASVTRRYGALFAPEIMRSLSLVDGRTPIVRLRCRLSCVPD